jgi:diguanylate cyclase (GGDEF)-like protein
MEKEPRLNEKSGLYPQRMLERLLANEMTRSQRYPNPLSLLYIALRFDQTPTPETLESAHVLLTNMLHAKLREVDMPGHYQGNYLVIMPLSDAEGARVAMERLVDQIRGMSVQHTENGFNFSICAGVVSHPGGNGMTPEELLSRASTALWEAHKQGPHTIVVFDDAENKMQ